jgi:nicotinate-nucleotide pyrophosphorylase (carboxylating)
MNEIIDDMENKIESIIRNALEEDIRTGDITTIASIPSDLPGKGIFLLKDDGIVAGLNIVEKVFRIFDDSLVFIKYTGDGEYNTRGKVIAEVKGSVSSILTAERTALNFLQRMSGIATAAYQLSSLIKHTKAKIIDTRKTVPGLRLIDKMAVRLGGCNNHRTGLYDMFLIKDNHIAAAGSITKAVDACREYNKKNNSDFKIEVETTNLDEVNEAIESGADIIMLDNFNVDEMIKAVELIKDRAIVEASGMVNKDTVVAIAETGVDFISVGAITHSVKALDISLDITKQ